MQRPGRDPADPPCPSPWTASPDDACRTRLADGEPAGTAAADTPADPPPCRPGPPAASPPDPTGPYGRSAPGQPGPYGTGPGPYGPGQPGLYGTEPGPYGTEPGPYGPDQLYPAAGWPPPRPPQRSAWPPTHRELVTGLATILALAVLGAVLALLWVQLAPRLAFRVVQPGRALPVVPEGEEYVATDGRFVLITLGAGVLAGLACWLLRASRGPVVLVALALGGLLGAVVTWRVGLWLEPGYRPEDLQEVGRTVYQPLELGAQAALVVEPVAAVLVYLLCAGFAARNDLGVGPAPPAAHGNEGTRPALS